ncbi:MAG TPA: hypothetical protein VGO09_00420, partial [Flavisolibacter sp.]|nr:hypothetical protein [Flavisolibacter sp.]
CSNYQKQNMYNKIKFLWLLIASFVFDAGVNLTIAQSPSSEIKWVIEKNSTLRVDGKSNVNSFTCNIKDYVENDTISYNKGVTKLVNLSGHIQMGIIEFNCHSKQITNDLRKTLKAKDYPNLVIRFISLQSIPTFENKTETIKGWVEVELAGIKKKFELIYTFSKSARGNIQLNGGRSFSFSDFKLSPPRKLAGLVKVKDEFVVNFQLILRTV